MRADDNPYAAPVEDERASSQVPRGGNLHIDNWWYAASNLVFARIFAVLIAASALWTAITTAHAEGRPNRILYLQLMFSLLWIVMMGIVFWRRGRYPIIFWCDLGDRLTFGRLNGPEEYPGSSVRSFDYEGIGNPTRVPVVY